nr:hypothetical protein [Brasilonema sp. UFV-L1]
MTHTPLLSSFQSTAERPNAQGRFRGFGSKYVPQMRMNTLAELETAYQQLRKMRCVFLLSLCFLKMIIKDS